MLDSRLRGNDGYFDRLVLKKARGYMKAWPRIALDGLLDKVLVRRVSNHAPAPVIP
jgi:hypothetical protein